MTTEIEKTFFNTFGIDPYDRYLNCTENLEVDCNRNCNCCDKAEDVYCYPEITDRILLELICIYLDYRVLTTQMSVKHLKQTVLQGLIELHEQYNHKIGYYEEVRTLFEEG